MHTESIEMYNMNIGVEKVTIELKTWGWPWVAARQFPKVMCLEYYGIGVRYDYVLMLLDGLCFVSISLGMRFLCESSFRPKSRNG